MQPGQLFERSYRVGFDFSLMDKDVIERMLKLANLDFSIGNIQDMSQETLDSFDTIVLLNPMLDHQSMNNLLASVGSGTSILLMMSLDIIPAIANSPLLHHLGISIGKTKKFKKLKFSYTRDYMVPMKQGVDDHMLTGSKKQGAFFNYQGTGHAMARAFPIMTHKNLKLAMQVNYGRGMIIIMNSFCLPVVRAEIFTHVLRHSNAIKKEEMAGKLAGMEAELPALVAEMFTIYDELPIDTIARKMGIDQFSYEDFGKLIPLLEQLIVSGKIHATIRGEVLAKRSPVNQESNYFG